MQTCGNACKPWRIQNTRIFCAPGKPEPPLLDGWLTRWRRLWPETPSKFVRPLDQLVDQLQQLAVIPDTEDETDRYTHDRELLTDKLIYAFRRCSHQPATAFLHLAMVALDLQQLRAALLRRTLFPEFKGEGT